MLHVSASIRGAPGAARRPVLSEGPAVPDPLQYSLFLVRAAAGPAVADHPAAKITPPAPCSQRLLPNQDSACSGP
jgi:hypothetical protein